MPFVKKRPGETIEGDERKQPRDCNSLVRALEDADPLARRWIVRDLVDCPDASGPLVDQLRRETDPEVREVILTALTQIGDEAAVDGLIECLRSEDPRLRNEAIEVMKQLPDEVAAAMGGLLADADPDVRIFAVNVLESLRHPQVESWLIGVIENDPHVNVCGAAVDLLSEVASEQARPALANLKARFPGEPYIAFAADLALRRIGET